MEQRYWLNYDVYEDVECIFDENLKRDLDMFEVMNLLNEQDKKIKKLEKKVEKYQQQLSNEEKSHDLCIDIFNEECERLRKQIKFESEARKRFKQSQNSKAIEVLEDLKKYFALKDVNLDSYDIISDYGDILEWLADKITELRGVK